VEKKYVFCVRRGSCSQEEKEKKKADLLERKKESQRLAEEEMASIKPASGARGATDVSAGGKVTRADIEAHQAHLVMAAATANAAASSSVVVVDELPIEENVNRMVVDGLEARSVDEAIKLLR